MVNHWNAVFFIFILSVLHTGSGKGEAIPGSDYPNG